MKIKWPNGALAPVLLWMDDLCNTYVDINQNGLANIDNDWGHLGLRGVYKYLNEEILSKFPQVKTTYFVPVGIRSPVCLDSKIKQHSWPIDFSKESIDFFKHIHLQDNSEISYHGLTHGIASKFTKGFVQEWDSFSNIEEALQTIEKGKEIFKNVTGENPLGGKYCGYKSNNFSDQSIDYSGFIWWCRYYNVASVMNKMINKYYSGEDMVFDSSFNIKVFGKNKVIDIPTTVDGSFLTNYKKHPQFIKSLSKIFKRRLLHNHLDKLINNNLVISIQEHISYSRVDLKRQRPNIQDDRDSLIEIFSHLSNYNLWYCTATELAEYIRGNKFEVLNY